MQIYILLSWVIHPEPVRKAARKRRIDVCVRAAGVTAQPRGHNRPLWPRGQRGSAPGPVSAPPLPSP